MNFVDYDDDDVYDEIEVFYHVTSKQNRNSIMSDGKFELYHATDHNYDGELFNEGAPDVVFFSAGLFRGDLPTKTLYPRNGASNSISYRIMVDCYYIAEMIDHYSVYKIDSIQEGNKYTHMLFYFVDDNDKNTINWCENYLSDKKYDIFDQSGFREDCGDLAPIYFDETRRSFMCLKMDDKYAINLAFSEDFQQAFLLGLVTDDTVKHF